MSSRNDCIFSLGDHQSLFEKTLLEIRERQVLHRIWRQDYTVWKDDPSEITNRLGWLRIPEKMTPMLPGITAVVDEIRRDGYTRALLLGMGGSSLAPEVLRFTFGVKPGFLDLSVLDSTDPRAVSMFAEQLDPKKTLYIVSTKSGGTVETASFAKYFYNQVKNAVGAEDAGNHFIAITDPGSGLETLAKNLNFRKTFLNDPDIGGRYSALSYFGLFPAALIGVDVSTLLDRAVIMARNNEASGEESGNEHCAVRLGAVMGGLAASGTDKLTLIISPAISRFGAWTEQLIAESTGKEGKGILPVDGETLLSPDFYAEDRLFVYLRLKKDPVHDEKVSALQAADQPVVQIDLNDLYDIGREFFRWELATAVAGHLLGINPFDQPNVESAKVQARSLLAAYEKDGRLPEPAPALISKGITVYTGLTSDSLEGALENFFKPFIPDKETGTDRSYIALHAYLEPCSEIDEAIGLLRESLQQRMKMATTAGYGPRFLHSTGQLHKGDAGNGLFIQLMDGCKTDVPIPQSAGDDASVITFGTLQKAQALGDRQALLDGGRKVITFHLGNNAKEGLRRLSDAVKNMTL